MSNKNKEYFYLSEKEKSQFNLRLKFISLKNGIKRLQIYSLNLNLSGSGIEKYNELKKGLTFILNSMAKEIWQNSKNSPFYDRYKNVKMVMKNIDPVDIIVKIFNDEDNFKHVCKVENFSFMIQLKKEQVD